MEIDDRFVAKRQYYLSVYVTDKICIWICFVLLFVGTQLVLKGVTLRQAITWTDISFCQRYF